MAEATWYADLQSALDARVKGDVVLARSAGGVREYAAVQASAISTLAGELFEVVTDGSCYMHFCIAAGALTEAAWKELSAAIVGALPDVPTVKDMAPIATAVDGRVRVVYRDVMLGDIADNLRIAKAILAFMDDRPDEFSHAKGCLLLDVYERGHCTPLRAVSLP